MAWEAARRVPAGARGVLGLRTWGALLLLGLSGFPLVASALRLEFYLGVLTKALILGLAASGLNLALGYGGLLSFGHATYFGLGAYTVAVLAREGIRAAWLVWPAGVLLSALAALGVGSISLRTRGLPFIMITLAFAQMFYYGAISFKQYGGEDGLRAPRTDFGLALGDVEVYYLTLACLVLCLGLLWRIVHARFGRALQATRDNESRAAAIGFPVYPIRLVAFVISGAITGLAGILMAHLTQYASPAMLSWPQSGHLMLMVILGGVGHFWGGVLGALAMVALEEIFHSVTVHWQLGVGLLLLLTVLLAPRGIAGILEGRVR